MASKPFGVVQVVDLAEAVPLTESLDPGSRLPNPNPRKTRLIKLISAVLGIDHRRCSVEARMYEG